jgi:protein TonB
MNQPIRNLCFTSSAALHVAAVGLLAWSAGEFIPQITLQNGSKSGLESSISTTTTAPVIQQFLQHADAVIVDSTVDRADVLNPAAALLLPAVLKPTQVQAPQTIEPPDFRAVSFGQFADRPRGQDLLNPIDVRNVVPVESQPDKAPAPGSRSTANDESNRKTNDATGTPKPKVDSSPTRPTQPVKSSIQHNSSQSEPTKTSERSAKSKQVQKSAKREPQTNRQTKESNKTASTKNSEAGNQGTSNGAGLQVDELPRKLAGNVAPQYPAYAYRNGQQGVVYLLVEIDEQGHVTKANVHRSSGFDSLDVAARRAVLQWRFRPGVLNKNNVASRALVPVRFRID